MHNEIGQQSNAMCGRENFTGYIIDLIDAVAAHMQIKYKLCIAKDEQYGKELENGTWNGVIGELVRGVSIKWYMKWSDWRISGRGE